MTTTPPSPVQVKRGTWGALLPHLRALGVSVETGDGKTTIPGTPLEYLRRTHEGRELTYVLPFGMTPDRKIGWGKMANICLHLRIAEPPNWPIDF